MRPDWPVRPPLPSCRGRISRCKDNQGREVRGMANPTPRKRDRSPQPTQRRLRVFAFDPQASTNLDTAVINDALIELPWERDWEDPLKPGPVNEYVEVVDFDPASRCFYPP